MPVWYDAAMIASFAGVGLVLGLGSILLVQGVVERRFGAAVGWLMLAPVFFLCSAGIYIGRVHRLNSWDAITSPGTLLRGFADRLADPLAQPEAIAALIGAMGLLSVAYLVLYTISDLRLDRVRAPTAANAGTAIVELRTLVEPNRRSAGVRVDRRRGDQGADQVETPSPFDRRRIGRNSPRAAVRDLDREPVRLRIGSHADPVRRAGVLDRVGDCFMGREDEGDA